MCISSRKLLLLPFEFARTGHLRFDSPMKDRPNSSDDARGQRFSTPAQIMVRCGQQTLGRKPCKNRVPHGSETCHLHAAHPAASLLTTPPPSPERTPASKAPRTPPTTPVATSAQAAVALYFNGKTTVGNSHTWGCDPEAACDFGNVEIGEFEGVHIDLSSPDRTDCEPIAYIDTQGKFTKLCLEEEEDREGRAEQTRREEKGTCLPSLSRASVHTSHTACSCGCDRLHANPTRLTSPLRAALLLQQARHTWTRPTAVSNASPRKAFLGTSTSTKQKVGGCVPPTRHS